MSEIKRSWLSSFYTFLKVIFITLLLLQFIPYFLIKIKGNIDDLLSARPMVGLLSINDELISARGYCKLLEKFEKNEDIRALIVYFEAAPGGYPGTSQMLFQEIVRFKTKKPVVAMIENMCASGAYYIASGADKIITTASAQVGSIGVIARIPNVKGLLDSCHIKHTFIQSGTYKTAADPLKEIAPEEIVYLQQLADDVHMQFIKDVAAQRGLDVAKAAEWGNGKCFTGNQAFEYNLVDQVGTFRDAIESAKMLAGIKDEVRIVSVKKHKAFAQQLLSGDEDDDGLEVRASDAAATFMAQVCAKVLKLFGFQAKQAKAELYL